MAFRYDIPRGLTQSPLMSAGYCGASILVRYFDAGGAQVQPTVEGVISVSTTESLEDFIAVSPAGAALWLINGPILRIRLSLTGTGATAASVEIWRYTQPMDLTPNGLYSGFRAQTQQGYIEANTKNGVQFYIQHALPQLVATTGVYKILFTTGAKRVLVKAREMYGNGGVFSLQIFKQPTAPSPGGSPITVQNYNDDTPVATSVSVLGGVTTTSNGTPWGDPQRLFGSAASGQRAGSGLAPGGDRVLKRNSSYLIEIKNTGSGTADIDYFLSWYEGGSDLPLRQ